MQLSGIGRVIFWAGANLWIGRAVDPIPLHAHHAIQLCFGFEAPVEFRPAPKAPWSQYPGGAMVRPGAPHEFQAPGREAANILFEPESALGRALLERFPDEPIVALDQDVTELASAYRAGADDAVLVQETMALIARLAGGALPRKPTDQRVLTAIDWIRRHLDEEIRLGEVAAVAGLSEGRFRHLFVDEIGMGLRPYVLWTRLNKALELGFGGTSWTEAAHATNFADSAHLTRTCRRMYGLVPTSMRVDRMAQSDRRIA